MTITTTTTTKAKLPIIGPRFRMVAILVLFLSVAQLFLSIKSLPTGVDNDGWAPQPLAADHDEKPLFIPFPSFDPLKSMASPNIEDHEIYHRQLELAKQGSGSAAATTLGGRLPCPTTNTNTNTTHFDYHKAANNTNFQQIPSSQITVLFTGSARYCHPKLNLINAVWDTHLKYLQGFQSMPVMFAMDGKWTIKI